MAYWRLFQWRCRVIVGRQRQQFGVELIQMTTKQVTLLQLQVTTTLSHFFTWLWLSMYICDYGLTSLFLLFFGQLIVLHQNSGKHTCGQHLNKERKTRWSSHNKRLQSQGHIKNGPPFSKLINYCLLCCQEHSTLIFCLCQPTVTLHQGQGHQSEHEHT